MKKRKIAIGIIYSIILVLVTLFGYIYYNDSRVKLDREKPILETSISGSNVILNAKDNVGVYAYTYNSKNEIPDEWYEANEKKEFNTTLKIITSSTYYAWVKDKNGNISDVSSFTLDCLSGNFNGISDTIYCPYSSVAALGFKWHVLNDESGYITLFLDANQLEKMNHCDTLATSEYCYYLDNKNYDSYSWDKSLINHYLNNEFINLLNKGTEFKEESVCADRSGQMGCIDSDGCGGYLASQINDLGYFCQNQYVASKARLLTYKEYERILIDLGQEDKSWVYSESEYWTMNTWHEPVYAGFINKEGTFMVDGLTTDKKDIRPVITIKK